jgi:hypothetical protein
MPNPRGYWYAATILLGVIVGMFSFLFPAISIRCPYCGARWLWLAASKKHDAGWFDWLMSQSTCPICGYKAAGEGSENQAGIGGD